ncbi:uncharacterized protein LOC122015432 [Zingiber officinale]|uniref:BED-type domain-containing protein n=1 Tax=Zingiber officinale TaxID=94328 RepID=A0A8J5IHJ9_ZINOF|nr:uncharacterized protein LOC122015432 [Zingiber officinale]KAG6535220.1 hypothetical protein ZIOFF_000185 [Zingiber officinale]
MASASEIILPIGTQKHDPAWKHCLMVRSTGRTKLKCVYCFKLFLGGGIHRIKEHLARHKGNASCCPKVPLEVQLAMQHSLDGSSARRKKKLKYSEEATTNASPIQTAIPMQLEGGEVGSGMQMMQIQDVIDMGAVPVEVREEGVVSKPPEKVRKKRSRLTSPLQNSLFPQQTPALIADAGKSIIGDSVTKDQVCMAIGRFLFEAGVPLEAVNSPHFQSMVDALALVGPGVGAFSYHDFRGWILKRSVEEMNNTLEQYRATWSRTGCSVLADEWITATGKTLINFLVYCPEGTMFLKSVDASHIVSSADTLYELLKHVVEEVGEKNVVQVITNYTEIHIAAGSKLTEAFPTLFWTSCSSQCIEAMLEDISKLGVISEIIENAKAITGFMYSHATILNMMRNHTNGKDLIVSCNSRPAMSFIALKNMISLKENLRTMITSEEWLDSPYSRKPAGLLITDLICSLNFWSSCVAIARITEPLLRVLKLVESNKKPAMGYIHLAMYQAKQTIKKELVKKEDYMTYWEIIDWRWNRQLPCPLYAAAFFLNPRFFFSIQGDVSNEISSGVLDCIERLVPDANTQDKIQKELSLYKSSSGDFGRKMAIRARNTLLPAEWWLTYGGACPNLMRLAIHILSQTCSMRGSERVQVPFEQIHNHRMNYLEHQRLSDLIFVHYNLRLQRRQIFRQKPFDPISVDNIDVVGDWVVEKNELFSVDDEPSNWMLLNQPVEAQMQWGNVDDEEIEAFLAGIDDEVIQGAGKNVEDDGDVKEEVHVDASFT